MSQAVSAPIINAAVLPELSQKSRRGRKKSVGSLVFTDRGQEYVVGYDRHGDVVSLTKTEAEQFARAFYVVRRSWSVRFITYLYNKHALSRR